MPFLDATILGIVEGLTEFLPVSSTGHLILVSTLLRIPETDFLKSFEISIQLGAMLAVVILYFKQFLSPQVIARLIVAFIPTGIVGLVVYPLVKSLLGSPLTVIVSLLLGGIALILFEYLHTTRTQAPIESITYKQAFLIGCCQSIAVIPGISRSAATIVGGLLLGLDRNTAVRFSFLLAVPTIAAATLLDLTKTAFVFSSYEWISLSIGFIAAFIVAVASIRLLLSYIRRYSFIPFGYYRIAIALIAFMIIF